MHIENGERRSTDKMSLRMITKPLNSNWKIKKRNHQDPGSDPAPIQNGPVARSRPAHPKTN
ncbi:hypothetical protein TH8_06970 [Thalassospira profundimaris]|nr:hypothetical protein TH8_06970 [Thalassospira profundimaris]